MVSSSNNTVFSIDRQMLRLMWKKKTSFYNWSFYSCSFYNCFKFAYRCNTLFLETNLLLKVIAEALTGIWKYLGNSKFLWALKTKKSTIVKRLVFDSAIQYSIFLVFSRRLMWSLWTIGAVISITDWWQALSKRLLNRPKTDYIIWLITLFVITLSTIVILTYGHGFELLNNRLKYCCYLIHFDSRKCNNVFSFECSEITFVKSFEVSEITFVKNKLTLANNICVCVHFFISLSVCVCVCVCECECECVCVYITTQVYANVCVIFFLSVCTLYLCFSVCIPV